VNRQEHNHRLSAFESRRHERKPIMRIPTALAAMACTLLSGCAASRPPLDGAWECLTPPPASEETRTVKILADGRFAFGRQSLDGATVYAGGGTYHYSEGEYVETVSWHWLPVLVGQTIVFDCRLEDGLWYHRATFEVGGRQFDIDEVWRRVGEPKPGTAGMARTRDGDGDRPLAVTASDTGTDEGR
jgi:hypothetical protein